MTQQKPHPVVPTLRRTEAPGNTSDVDVHVHVHLELLIESAGSVSLPVVPRPDVAFLDVALRHFHHPNVPQPDAFLYCSVGQE